MKHSQRFPCISVLFAAILLSVPAYAKTDAQKPTKASAKSIDKCVDAWADAYRKERGDDAMIATDQINEWKGWCKAGKHPR